MYGKKIDKIYIMWYFKRDCVKRQRISRRGKEKIGERNTPKATHVV